jgi:hypothetical protein
MVRPACTIAGSRLDQRKQWEDREIVFNPRTKGKRTAHLGHISFSLLDKDVSCEAFHLLHEFESLFHEEREEKHKHFKTSDIIGPTSHDMQWFH